MTECKTSKKSEAPQSAGGRARALMQQQEARQRIDEYNANPNLCLYCQKPILAPYGKKLRETKIKKFCSRSCSAQYYNRIQDHSGDGPPAFIDTCSDDKFLKVYYDSTTYSELTKALGYAKSVSSNVKKKIIQRIQSLGLQEYTKKKFFDTITKQELIDRSSNWQSWRSQIQKDARKQYAQSDKPKQCVVCGYSNTYEVSHIKPVSEFDDEIIVSQINNISNLIALCPNHHWEYDHGLLDITDYIQNETIS